MVDQKLSESDINSILIDALQEFDALIKHNYSGSRQAMSDLTYAAQKAHAALIMCRGQHIK